MRNLPEPSRFRKFITRPAVLGKGGKVKRREYRVVWWSAPTFNCEGKYVADDEIFTSKAKAIKHAGYSCYRPKVQWRVRGSDDPWKFCSGVKIVMWEDRVRRAARKRKEVRYDI